jgi:arylsulfatase A-like enzyme
MLVLDGMKKSNFTVRFSLAGILIGFFVGICEGSFLFLYQHPLYDPRPDLAILILAPLVDALVFGFLGMILGSAADLCHRKVWCTTSPFIALGLVIAGCDLTFSLAHRLIHISQSPRLVNAGIALMGGLIVATAAPRYWPIIWSRCIALAAQFWPPSRALIRQGALFTGAMFVGLVVAAIIMRAPEACSQLHPDGVSGNRPNLVMIALDTARADHFSAYGYTRPTTPNLDKLAKKGVLFETAIAPAPWTLPSFATVFTGLLPHQNQAGWEMPVAKGLATLASILSARGYQTTGFNANYTQGTARTGLAQGFELYNDDDGSLLTDLWSIGFVKAFSWLVYYPFIRADYLPRRDARTLNRAVFHWLGHRPKQPFFLFVNYFDVHDPYCANPDVGNQFGNAQPTLAYRIRAVVDGLPLNLEAARSPAEQATLIAGYDSSLAYADSQIGSLLQLLESSPEWSNTYIIVFADHGQAFGTHRHYGHGWGLNWELLHVPLIIAGPGIPQGRRVKDLVGLQQLFATVLDLSGGEGGVPRPNSLRCSWKVPQVACDSAPMVISELGTIAKWGLGRPAISVVTPQWHLIRDAADDLQLYNLTTDPGEEVNLAGSPEHQTDIAVLQSRLFELVQTSSPPWLGENYMWALGERQFSLLAAKHLVHTNWPSLKFQPPSSQEENELLHSIPYQ